MDPPKKSKIVKIGIIGGTGLDDPDILDGREEKDVDTPYGKPSDKLILGKIAGVDCVLLGRHSRSHSVSPSQINFRANAYALHQEGCTHVIATTACGSLQEHIAPGHMVFIDQFIDRTYRRECTFYDGVKGHLEGVCHATMAKPFCEELRQILMKTAKDMGMTCHEKGTMVTIEGPRFSSRAESLMFRQWNGDVINMTTVPEVVLFREIGMLYAAVGLATDYDCWKDDEDSHVSAKDVMKTLKKNAENTRMLLKQVVPQIAKEDWSELIEKHKRAAKDAIIS